MYLKNVSIDCFQNMLGLYKDMSFFELCPIWSVVSISLDVLDLIINIIPHVTEFENLETHPSIRV